MVRESGMYAGFSLVVAAVGVVPGAKPCKSAGITRVYPGFSRYVCNCRENSVWGTEWENFSAVVEVVEVVEWRVTLVRTASMPSPDAAARHTGAGVARRQTHHERMRDERAREAAAGDAELPPEDDACTDCTPSAPKCLTC